MTRLVRDGSATGAKHVLFSELQREIISANPMMLQDWKLADEAEAKHRATLQKTGARETRHTGSPLVKPDSGTRSEGAMEWAMSRRDKLLRAADVQIRDGLIEGLLTPRTTEHDQVFKVVGHDWAREIAPADSTDKHIHRGSLYMEDAHGKQRHLPIVFNADEVNKFVHRAKGRGKDSAIADAAEWLRSQLADASTGQLGKEAYAKIAKMKFGILRKTFMEKVWKVVASAEHRKAGRKPKSAGS